MSIQLDHNARVPVRLQVTQTGTSNLVTTTNEIEHSIKTLLIAAFQAIPNQSGATATVANIVTALQTLP